MGRHRRREQVITPALAGYEHVLLLLHTHRPGRRSGLCLACGQRWPCPLLHRTIDDLAQGHHPPNRSTPTMNEPPRRTLGNHLHARTEPARRGGWFGEPQTYADTASPPGTTTSRIMTRAATGIAPPPSSRPRAEIPAGSSAFEVMRRVAAGLRRLDVHKGSAPSTRAVNVEPR
jgi:hypothetical protein